MHETGAIEENIDGPCPRNGGCHARRIAHVHTADFYSSVLPQRRQPYFVNIGSKDPSAGGGKC
jgi:hypothetical protein